MMLMQKRLFSTSRNRLKETLMATLDILGDSKAPYNSVERITSNSIIFTSGIEVDNRHVAFLISNKLLQFKPKYRLIAGRVVDFDEKSLEFLKFINPHPDLYVLGLGTDKSRMLSDANIKMFRELGIRLEISSTRNACRSYNILATERPGQVGAIFLQ